MRRVSQLSTPMTLNLIGCRCWYCPSPPCVKDRCAPSTLIGSANTGSSRREEALINSDAKLNQSPLRMQDGRPGRLCSLDCWV